MKLQARTASADDVMLMYGWANDPLVRDMSLNQGTVPLDTYKRFFSALRHDTDVLLLIVEGLKNEVWAPVAHVRLHKDGAISVSVAADYRGKRLASPVISTALDFAAGVFPLDTVIARIQHRNVASIRAFEGAGFTFSRETMCKGQPCVEYVYRTSAL
ncbi:MAG: GNAT family N-acetyltransferase [Candidatus Aquicultor sp.]